MGCFRKLVLLSFILQPYFTLATQPQCKGIPGKSWPSDFTWSNLNNSLSGRLLKPSPPGAVCHPDQPTYNPAGCATVQADWTLNSFHADNPVSSMENNWNNDTCLPNATICSGEGYPIYVINATCADDVKKGIDFARSENIRLIVKGTGHDYLGRSSAPNSLSIWTHYIQGLKFHDGFSPKGCQPQFSIDGPAITAGAGSQMLELNYEAHLRNLTIVSGGSSSVGVGGYFTGGGQGALSSTYGLGADQVLEIEMVTPSGEVLLVNECQNTDLFWAMRGGGGSTFGVLTSITMKAFPSAPFISAVGILGTAPGGEEAYWDVLANLLSQYASLDAQHISVYSFCYTQYTNAALGINDPVIAYYGSFHIQALYPGNTSESLVAAIGTLLNSSTAAYPGQFLTRIVESETYPDFWAWWNVNPQGSDSAGGDILLGSRLLDEKALSANLTALKEAIQIAGTSGTLQPYLVAGRGVRNAKPRGGSNAVNPAWRKALSHTITGVGWPALNETAKSSQQNLLTNVYVEALRQLAPDMGAYVNEADPYEPNFQQTFWGDNYPRLLSIKKEVDPKDVFWCLACVGNEGWQEVGNMLCRI